MFSEIHYKLKCPGRKQIFQHFCRISDCDIGHHSILHAIQVVDKSTPAKKSSEASVNTATADSMPMNKRLLDLQGQIVPEPLSQSTFGWQVGTRSATKLIMVSFTISRIEGSF